MDANENEKADLATPGPLKIAEWRNRGKFYADVESTDGTIVARCHCDAADIEAIEATRADAKRIAAGPQMVDALKKLIWPEAPSADDLMLLFLASGVTARQQEKFRPYVEKVRAAQQAGREALKAAGYGA